MIENTINIKARTSNKAASWCLLWALQQKPRNIKFVKPYHNLSSSLSEAWRFEVNFMNMGYERKKMRGFLRKEPSKFGFLLLLGCFVISMALIGMSRHYVVSFPKCKLSSNVWIYVQWLSLSISFNIIISRDCKFGRFEIDVLNIPSKFGFLQWISWYRFMQPLRVCSREIRWFLVTAVSIWLYFTKKVQWLIIL